MHTRRVLRRLAAAPRWLLGLAIIGVLVALALLPQAAKVCSAGSKRSYDARLATTLGKGGDPQVVIVDIDEARLQQGRWPWSRDKVSLLTRQIFDKHQARAIAFDVVFAERDRSGGADVLIGLALDELRDVAGYKHEFDPVQIEGDTLRLHWLVSFKRAGKIYFFADSKRPGYVAGPYDDAQAFIDDYRRYRARTIIAFRELPSYQKQRRERAPSRPTASNE